MSNLFRILCVAPSSEEILMWSYYSNDHTGYCFEYRTRDILDIIIRLKLRGICIIGPVKYSDSRPPQKSRLSTINITEIKFYIQAAFTKFTEWKHEKEYRYVILSDEFEEDSDPYLTFNIPVKQVYEGCKGDGAIITDTMSRVIPTKMMKKDTHNYRVYS